MSKNSLFVSVVIIVFILLAQSQSYYTPHDFSIDTETDGDTVTYSIHGISDELYSEIHLDNGFDTPSTYYLLRDNDYPMERSKDTLDSMTYLFSMEMSRCPSLTIKTLNASNMYEMMSDSISTGEYGYGIVMFGGAIPDIMYDGTSSSTVIQWMNGGGCLYWTGEPFGKYISTSDGIKEIPNYHETVSMDLFGMANAINDAEDEIYAEEKINRDMTDTLKVLCNETTYGVNTSIPSETLFLGYEEGGYASAAIIKYGSGMLSVFGSASGSQYSYYVAHVLSFHMTYKTVLIDKLDGEKTSDSTVGSFTDVPGQSHFVMLHDLRVSKIWIYDRANGRFV